MDCVNCYEVTARLHAYLDRELNTIEITEVQQHLESCPHCEDRFHFDLHLKRLLHEKCSIQCAPSHLREAVLRIAHTPLGQPVVIDSELALEIKADMEGTGECP
jgi:mycothiol system anti-sigma-R factor